MGLEHLPVDECGNLEMDLLKSFGEYTNLKMVSFDSCRRMIAPSGVETIVELMGWAELAIRGGQIFPFDKWFYFTNVEV